MSDLFPDKFECFILQGTVLKNDVDGKWQSWTAEDGEAFWDDFIEWLASKRLCYGGGFGADTQFDCNERD